MRVDTLTYTYVMKASLATVYQILLKEQFKFFQRHDQSLTQLDEGTQISRLFQTKTQKKGVPGTVTIIQLTENYLFQMETAYAAGRILQTYQFKAQANGQTEVTYSEKNSFVVPRHQYSFMLVGLIYKFTYNRGIKKRLQYIERLAQET